ncbi:MAG: FIG00825370: hypothetical protein, partial [uncultured Blastococcus sp.]
GGRGPGLLRRGRRAAAVPGDPRRGAAPAGALPRAPAGRVRPARGRHAGRGPLARPLAALPGAQPGPDRPARGGGRHRTERPRPRGGGRAAAAQQRRGLHPPGAGLAGLHLAHVLAPRPRLPVPQPPGGARRGAGVADRPRRRRGRCRLPVRRPRRPAPGRLGAPHPAPDGARQLRPPARHRPLGHDRLVPRELRRRLRVGDGRQRRRHEPARRRGRAGHQALRLRRRLHRPDERLLRRLPLRPQEAPRGRRLPLHRRLLGVPRPHPRPAGRQPPHAPAAAGPRPARRPRRRRRAGTAAGNRGTL